MDPSVLDYVHQEDNGGLIRLMIQLKGFNLAQSLMNLVIVLTDHFLFLTNLMILKIKGDGPLEYHLQARQRQHTSCTTHQVHQQFLQAYKKMSLMKISTISKHL